MGKKGRPRLGGEARTERILVCLEHSLRAKIEGLAAESRRSLSDYCRYVLEHHVIAVKEEEAEEATEPEITAPEPIKPVKAAVEMPSCGTCSKPFADCDCPPQNVHP